MTSTTNAPYEKILSGLPQLLNCLQENKTTDFSSVSPIIPVSQNQQSGSDTSIIAGQTNDSTNPVQSNLKINNDIFQKYEYSKDYPSSDMYDSKTVVLIVFVTACLILSIVWIIYGLSGNSVPIKNE